MLKLCATTPAGVVVLGCANHPSPFADQPDWVYDFSDRPDGPIDSSMWKSEVGTTIPSYNHEVATYTTRLENLRVESGALIIEARREWADGKPYTSAYVDTHYSKSFRYGRIDVEMKMPAGVGTWPAAWMLPSAPRYHAKEFGLVDSGSSWPLNGEIDIVESIGAQPNTAFGNAHSYNSNMNKGISDNAVGIEVNDLTTAFNTYSVEWLPDSITFLVNGTPYHSIRKQSDDPLDWPFDQDYYLILNLAMGGSWGGEKYKEYPPDGVDPQYDSWVLAVRSIRHYPLRESLTSAPPGASQSQP